MIDLDYAYSEAAALQTRADIRRSIKSRRSVQNNEPDRLANQLERASYIITILADELKRLQPSIGIGS